MALKLGELVAYFKLDDKEGQKRLQTLKGKVRGFAGNIDKHMVSAGKSATKYLTLPILGAGLASTKMAMDLNKNMANVGTLIPGQGDRLLKFKGQIQDMAKSSGMATDSLADGLYQTISALGDMNDPIAQLNEASKAARAGGATTKDAIDLLAMVTKNYGDTSSEAIKKVSDLSFTAVKLGVTTFPELAASMGSVAGAAKTLGVSQEELFASYATLTGVTGNTSEVSTQLSAIMGGMIKPTKGMSKLMKKLGYESAAAMIQEEGFAGSLEVLKKQTGGSVSKLGKLFESKEALRTLLPLLGEQSQAYSDKLKAMETASGATAAALNEQENGINKSGHAYEKMKQNLVVAAQKVGDKLLPVLTRLGDKLVPLLDRISNMSDAQLEFGIKAAAAAAAIGPLLIGLGSMVGVVMKARSAWLLLNGAAAAKDIAKAAGALDGAAASAANVGTQASGAAGKVTKLGKAFGVAAALAVGWEIGQIINDKLAELDKQGISSKNRLARDSITLQSENNQQLDKRKAMLQKQVADMQGVFGFMERSFSANKGDAYSELQRQIIQVENQKKLNDYRGYLASQTGDVGRRSSAASPDLYQPINGLNTGQSLDITVTVDSNAEKTGVKVSKPATVKAKNGQLIPAGAMI